MNEWGLIPMHKGADGNVIGDLVGIPKEMQWKLYKQVELELEAYKNNPTVILAPLPRNLHGGVVLQLG
jgi:hypothetical protein